MEHHRKHVRLAQAAFSDALASRWDSAVRHVRRLSDECGGEGVVVAMMAWCDTYVDHATDGQASHAAAAARVNVAYVNTYSGRLDQQGSPDVPGPVQWAGRMLAARAAMDEAAWTAMMDELPPDGHVVGQHVLALLRAVARTVNGLPRGYARMGGAE
jgi:hypothetical protein